MDLFLLWLAAQANRNLLQTGQREISRPTKIPLDGLALERSIAIPVQTAALHLLLAHSIVCSKATGKSKGSHLLQPVKPGMSAQPEILRLDDGNADAGEFVCLLLSSQRSRYVVRLGMNPPHPEKKWILPNIPPAV